MLRVTAFCLLSLPTIFLGVGFVRQNLGANPIETLTHQTGTWALICLLISLSLTPLKTLGWKQGMKVRRMSGLFSFYYASLHFLIYWIFDQSLSFSYVWQDIADRPYITLGFSAWLLLIPLTVTSTKKMRQRLGRYWISLHKLVYPIAILVMAHYIWLIRADYAEVYLYSIWLSILLIFRLVHSKNLIRH